MEQTKGVLPYWLSPRQVTIIPISEEQNKFCQDLYNEFIDLDINVNVDLRNERISKKIREAQLLKTKFLVMIGKNEIDNNILAIRKYGEDKTENIKKENFIETLNELKKSLK